MRQKSRSRPEGGRGSLELVAELVVVSIDQALASLGAAEINLRNVRVSRLPRVAESLAVAAADLESLRGALSAAGPGSCSAPVLRAQMKKLAYAAGRVSALHQGAKDFHAGWRLVRQGDMAEYDALGGACGKTELHGAPHGLEARG